MKSKALSIISLITLLLLVSLSCSLFSGISEVRSTAQSVATEVEQGRNLLGTAKAMATNVGSSGMLSTAQALATDVGESGLLETAQALITDEAPALLETGQAFATEQGPDMIGTVEAMATQAAQAFSQAPPDIPVIPENENLIGTKEVVSYLTGVSFNDAVEFYKREMPQNDWQKKDSDWVENESNATLTYQKPNRLATVALTIDPANNRTIVIITITPK